MDLRQVRSFSTELAKIADEELLDADIRDLHAQRRGDHEYLPAGKLPTNTEIEDNWIPKLSESMNLDVSFKTSKTPGKAAKAYEYAMEGLKGAFLGGGLTMIGSKLRHGTSANPSTKIYRISVPAFSALAMGSKFLMERKKPSIKKLETKIEKNIAKQLIKKAFISPALELKGVGQVGKILSGRARAMGSRPVPGTFGKDFRIR